MNEESEELAKKFIIGYKPLTEYQEELYKHTEYIEHQLNIIEIRRKRLLRVWRVINQKLMATMEKSK